MRLPLAVSPAGASWARAGAAAKIATAAVSSRIERVMACSSARIGDDIDERRLAALDRRDGALQGRAEIVRIDDRALAMHPEAARDGRIVDVRVGDRGAD